MISIIDECFCNLENEKSRLEPISGRWIFELVPVEPKLVFHSHQF